MPYGISRQILPTARRAGRWVARIAESFAAPEKSSGTLKEPVGVVGAIIPWNALAVPAKGARLR